MDDQIETQRNQGCRLRVQFWQLDDRFGHEIQWLEGDVAHPLIYSFEGKPAVDWPPSPVLQNLHIENRSTSGATEPQAFVRQVALLVGMSGRSHWSLSVEPDPSSQAALVFDVACRIPPDAAAELRSTYQSRFVPRNVTAEGCDLKISDAWVALVRIVEIPGQLSNAPLDPSSPAFSISPVQQFGPTRRWKYRIELARSSDHDRIR